MKSVFIYAHIFLQLLLICYVGNTLSKKLKNTTSSGGAVTNSITFMTATTKPIFVTPTIGNTIRQDNLKTQPSGERKNVDSRKKHFKVKYSKSRKYCSLKCDLGSCSNYVKKVCKGKLIRDRCGCCPICVLESGVDVSMNFSANTTTKYITASPPSSLVTTAKKHPCDGIKCSKFEQCLLNIQGIPMCKCPNVFICKSLPMEHICSEDGESFKNNCLLKIKECQENRSIRVAHSGKCLGKQIERNRKREERKRLMGLRNRREMKINRLKNKKRQNKIKGTENKNKSRIKDQDKKFRKKDDKKSQNKKHKKIGRKNETIDTVLNKKGRKIKKEKKSKADSVKYLVEINKNTNQNN